MAAGHSLILARPSLGEGNRPRGRPATRWAAPGGPTYPIDPLRGVVINEFLAHPDIAALASSSFTTAAPNLWTSPGAF